MAGYIISVIWVASFQGHPPAPALLAPRIFGVRVFWACAAWSGVYDITSNVASIIDKMREMEILVDMQPSRLIAIRRMMADLRFIQFTTM